MAASKSTVANEPPQPPSPSFPLGVALLGPGPATHRGVLGLPDDPTHRLPHPNGVGPQH